MKEQILNKKGRIGCLGFLGIIFGVIVLAILFNRPTPTPPKPTSATTEVRPAEEARKTRLTEINKTAIRTMIETHDYFIVELEDTGSIVRISLELRFKPLSEAQLRNLAIDVCKNAVAYLRNISFKNRSVSVWLQSRADRGFITLYGRAFYSPILGSIDWRPKRG